MKNGCTSWLGTAVLIFICFSSFINIKNTSNYLQNNKEISLIEEIKDLLVIAYDPVFKDQRDVWGLKGDLDHIKLKNSTLLK